jgi:hypothetical protein
METTSGGFQSGVVRLANESFIDSQGREMAYVGAKLLFS